MFKFVVLCAFVAASVAEPEPKPEPQLLSTLPGLAYSGYPGYYASAPALTTYSSGPVISSSPYFYNSPGFTHFIKKRSPQFPFGYIAPSYYYPEVRTPVVSSTLYNTHLATPLAAAVPLTATHLIKKRSASPEPEPILPSTYVSSSYVQSALPVTSYNSYSSYYPGFYNYPSTYYPLAANTHFIKKRSAQFIPATSYLAQAGTYAAGAPLYSTQYAAAGAPIISSPYLANPYYPYSTYIKK